MTQEKKEPLQVFNVQKGIDHFSGDEEMYFSMLHMIESMSLDSGLVNLHKAMIKKDWYSKDTNVGFYAHTIKGAASNVYAEKLVDSARALEDKGKTRGGIKDESQYSSGDLAKLDQEIAQDYFRLIDAAIEVKLYLAKDIGKHFDPSALEEQKIEVSKVFNVAIGSSGKEDEGFVVDTSTKKSVTCSACTCNIF